MIRTLVVDPDAADEAEAQTRYYVERAGVHVALRFVAEIEAVYRGLAQRFRWRRVSSRALPAPRQARLPGAVPVRSGLRRRG
jgi:plasmid stabilization system protein ParE